jgi:hypothetical protein
VGSHAGFGIGRRSEAITGALLKKPKVTNENRPIHWVLKRMGLLDY